MIHIPIGNFVAVTAKGIATKLVQCEFCRCAYQYQIERHDIGNAWNAFHLYKAEAEKLAFRRATDGLARALEKGCEPVPCPECGWYQTEMLPLVRRGYQSWMFTVAVVCWSIAGLSLALLLLCFLASGLLWNDGASFLVEMILFGVITGGAFSAARWALSYLLFDPNTVDQEERKALGRARATYSLDSGAEPNQSRQ